MYQDVVDRNLHIYNKHGTEIWKQVMRDLPSPYPELAERLYIAKDWSDFFNISFYNLLEEGSHNFQVQGVRFVLSRSRGLFDRDISKFST